MENLSNEIIWKLFPVVGKRGRESKQKNIDGFIYTFNKYADFFGVDTNFEVCHFLSQVGHECDGFNAFSEYASGSAYEGRKDLGNNQKGDGVKFKGRGPIQTTGRNNYRQVGIELLKLPFLNDQERKLFENDGILKNPLLLEDPVWGTLAAFIYWNSRSLNEIAIDNKLKVTIRRFNGSKWYNYTCSPVEGLTRKINGGVNGLDDRLSKYNKALEIIK